ncbi:hypothetical protein LO772_00070 [Yinghuangia sp. ASG 101]|uniref:hypothetical protein n=1 Tax=Yinghuangia sp. ASG 101 TaxID=2896848 RepID=UPI001E3691CC|nr:hypothetical protein [Yinghuangia sp. ASG 101]UGQ12050.1 hypothetical protein LO772_00070 [Yinghuangia sp. ASG 101]
MGRKDLTAGSWGSFAERAARSLAAPAPRIEAAHAAAADASPAPAPPAASAEAGPPAPAEGGPWAWMDLPDGAGTVVVRAVRWVRSSSGAWALQVTAPGWKAMTDWIGGGWEPGPVDEYHVVPGTRVRPIPGQDYTGLCHDDDGRLVP